MRPLTMSMTLPSAIGLLLAASPAPAQSTGLEDMVGARAGQAEGELERRGYRNTGGEKGDDRSYTNWWNASRRQCVAIATMEGRYDSITPTPPADCGQSAARERDRSYSRPEPRRHSGLGAYPDELSQICRGEASAEFGRRPSEITTNAPIRQPNGYIVQGWFDRREGSRFFNCRFDPDGGFLGVN